MCRNNGLFFILLFTGLIGFSAHGTERKIFSINSKQVSFTWLKERHITISSNCFANGHLKNCEAHTALLKADSSKLEKDTYGRNPGALLCSKQLDGKVVWSVDAKKNERTFCLFKDGSLVGTGTLDYYGWKHSHQ